MKRRLFPALLLLAALACSSEEPREQPQQSDAPAAAAPEADPERWEEAIQAFEQEDAENPPEPGGVVFIGSSSIRRWDLEKSFPGKGYVNRGFGGSQMADAARYVDRILAQRTPDTVVLYEGDNDVGRGKSASEIVADYRAFVEKVRAKAPEARIVVIAVKPSLRRWNLIEQARETNAALRAITEQDPLMEFADVEPPMLGENGEPIPELFVEDGLHMTDAGYEIWEDVVGPLIAK